MKKYILMMLVVLAAGFTSCSNDDIPMEEDVTMKTFDVTFIVDPSNVVEGYKFELNPGELQVVPDDAQLRLRILLYDSNGELVETLNHKQSNYQSVWTEKIQLEAGTYTALVLSNVINIDNPNVEEYWTLENYGKIKDARLSKNQEWLGYQKEILGINNKQFSVSASNLSVSVDLEPVGAACYMYMSNLETYPGIDGYSLLTNHNVKYAFWNSSFDLKTEKDIAPNEGEDLWDRFNTTVGGCVGLSEIDFGNVKGAYFDAFFYLLPSQKQYFTFAAESAVEVGSLMYLPEVKAGGQYFFLCELGAQYDNFAFSGYVDVTGKTIDSLLGETSVQYSNLRVQEIHNAMSTSVFMDKSNNNVVYVKDLMRK